MTERLTAALSRFTLKGKRQIQRAKDGEREETMERVSDKTLGLLILGLGKSIIGSEWLIRMCLQELQERRNAEKAQAGINPNTENKNAPEAMQESERAILPTPCTVGFDDCTVKQWFQKINEELDELKDAVWFGNGGFGRMDHISSSDKFAIADEAADTITAITSMLEAMGIDERMRQEAQKRVNERNRERGRIK